MSAFIGVAFSYDKIKSPPKKEVILFMSRNNGRLYNLNHCTYVCQYHLVWCTKYRGKVLNTYIKQQFKLMFKQIAHWKGLTILQ